MHSNHLHMRMIELKHGSVKMRLLATLLLVGFGCTALVYGNTTGTDICSLPRVTGRCRALFFRYYFNTRRGACEMFVYGGCGGNENNFRTLEECQRTCPSIVAKTADTTQLRRPFAVTTPNLCSLVRCAAAECENPIPPNPDEGKCCYTCPRQTPRTASIEADRFTGKISVPKLINSCVGVFCAEQIMPLPCDNPIRPDGACCSRCPTATELAIAEAALGQCPPILPNTFGTCAVQCFGDSSCSPGERCCSNGCGYTCQPVTMKAAAQTRQSGVRREKSSASIMKSLLELAALLNKLEE